MLELSIYGHTSGPRSQSNIGACVCVRACVLAGKGIGGPGTAAGRAAFILKKVVLQAVKRAKQRWCEMENEQGGIRQYCTAGKRRASRSQHVMDTSLGCQS